MPRAPRLHVPGGLYHVILRGNHQQAVFDLAADYHLFEDLLARALRRYDARVHAYCWMTNHVHLAAQVGDARLGRLIQSVASTYARRKQQRVPTTGHLFERRYRAILVDTDAYWLTLVRYIHRNPVEAGIVADPRGLSVEQSRWLPRSSLSSLAHDGADSGDVWPQRRRGDAAYRRFVAVDDTRASTLEVVPCGAVSCHARAEWPRSSSVIVAAFNRSSTSSSRLSTELDVDRRAARIRTLAIQRSCMRDSR